MANIHTLHVYHDARELVRLVASIRSSGHFGDLLSQLQRAAISVVSNLCEGAGSGTDRQFIRYCRIARGSVNEVSGHLTILTDLGHLSPTHPAHRTANRCGRRLTNLIRALDPG